MQRNITGPAALLSHPYFELLGSSRHEWRSIHSQKGHRVNQFSK
jgi:hypothetical protein